MPTSRVDETCVFRDGDCNTRHVSNFAMLRSNKPFPGKRGTHQRGIRVPRSPSTHWRACLPSPYPITIDVMTECIGKSLDVPTSSVAVAYCRLGRRTLAQDDMVQREEGHRPSVRPLKTMPLPICPRHCYRSVPFREASLLGELRQLLQAINRDEARLGPIMAGTAPRMPAIGGCFLLLSMSVTISCSYPIRTI